MPLDKLFFKQRINRLFIFKTLNIALIFAALIVLALAVRSSESYFSEDVFYITPRINDNRFHFTLEDAETLRSVVNTDNMTYKTMGSAVVSAGPLNVFSRLILTCRSYFHIRNHIFIHGAAWTADMAYHNIAVVNETLAWQLFGNLDVVDLLISIGTETYRVIGVVEQGDVAFGNSSVYIPMNPAPNHRNIRSIYIESRRDDPLGTRYLINDFLFESGRNRGDYFITDLSRYIANIALKYHLFMFFLGIYIISVLLINSYKLFTEMIVNKKAPVRRRIATLTLAATLAAASIIIIIRVISFELWIPFGDGTRTDDIIAAITNRGFLPSEQYLGFGLRQLLYHNARANAALLTGVIALLNFIMVHSASKREGEKQHGESKANLQPEQVLTEAGGVGNDSDN